MIYVPEKEKYSCYVVQSEGIIRAYKNVPHNNSSIEYRDYYIESNYIYRDGVQQFSNYATIPICLESSEVTSEYLYRNDLDSILTIFLIMCIFIILVPLKVVGRMFKRFL